MSHPVISDQIALTDRPDAQSLRILRRLAAGQVLHAAADGWHCGAFRVTAVQIETLRRLDLLVATPDGGLRASAPGLAALARLAGGGDVAAAQRIIRRRRAEPERPSALVDVNLADSPLAWLRRRRLISVRQYDAGERLRADHELAQLPIRMTMRWDGQAPSRTRRAAPEALTPTEAQVAARRRVADALAAVGPGLGCILRAVVCEGQGLVDAERALRWPTRSGKLVLGLALDRLADFHRIK